MLEFSKYRALKNKIEIKFRYQEEIEMFGDPLKFSQIIFNLVANSLDALENCEQEEKRINIKATTNEKMGFIGRHEGVAVYAVCQVEE